MSEENTPQYGRRRNDYPGDNGASKYTVVSILQSEVARYAAIFVFVIPIAVFIYRIQLDIALIKQNHLTHIEGIEKELAEQKAEQIDLQKQVIELQKQQLVILEKLAK